MAVEQPGAPASKAAADVVLSVRNLTIDSTTGVRIVDDVTLSIRRGETLGVLGESGSGKSMTALAALGLLPADLHVVAGSIQVNGIELVGASPATLRELRSTTVGMVFQDPGLALDPTMKVGKQISEVLRRCRGYSSGDARRAAVELLARVEIADPESRVDAYPHQMSGGMRQRAVIAMALASGPSLLLADEPTASVDATIQARLLRLLAQLKLDEQLGLLLISHDLRVMHHIADRVAIMYAGRVVEVGDTGPVLSAPRHPYTTALLASVPSIRNSRPVQAIKGSPATPASRPPGCAFHPRCPRAIAPCTTVVPTLTTESKQEYACFNPEPTP